MKANPRVCAIASRSLPKAAISPSILAAIGALGLAGCVPPPPAMPTPTPSAAPAAPARPAPPPPAVADWRDAPATPGDWTYAANAGGSLASFGGGLFSLRCNPQARTVTLIRAAAPRATPVAIGITSSDASRALTGTSTAAGIEATLPARDPLLDAMALSRGRFAVAVAGERTLYVPSWTEVTRVVEDCR
ncbi:MAG TPA: hypothetical protein VMQ93_19115 [Novosphingobium sp.]|nr:hypothetical protein [Novosphingobium sp.]